MPLKILFSIFLLTISNLAFSSTITARLDSVNLLMGKTTTLHLEVVKDKKTVGYLPLFENKSNTQDYVTVCGDSVELSRNFIADTMALGSGKIQINYSIPLQAFDSGTYRLPQFRYVAGSDTSFSNNLTFNVVPVNVTAEDPIAGFAPYSEPEGRRFYDFVPDWILDFWWIFIIIVLVILLLFWATNRFKKTGTLLPQPIPLTPYEKAMNNLENLKSRKLWEKGMEKEYFTELTDILRTYLEERFGINAMEMTTRQIIDKINQSEFRDKKEYIRQILNIADFVKFAKVRPLPSDSIASYENAVKFVEETGKEEPMQETEQEEKGGEVKK